MSFRRPTRRRRAPSSVHALPPGWVAPAWLEHGVPPIRTMIGTVGSSRLATVDPRGLVTPGPVGWSLDWWIGAEDRWHFPSREVGVRQRLVEQTPVVETAMRIPGGDAVHRAYAVPGGPGGADLAVVEIENRTPTPFAVALAIRPYDAENLGRVEAIDVQGRTVRVGGRTALLLPKEAARVAGGSLQSGDAADVVTAGGASAGAPSSVVCDAGLASAALLVPLPHTAVLRVAMPISAGHRGRRLRRWRRSVERPSVLDVTLPSSAAVVAGWQVHGRRGLRFELPPGTLSDAIVANQRFRLLREEPHEPEVDLPPDDGDRLDLLHDLLASASATYTWPEQDTKITFLRLAHALLVREVPDGLALLPAVPSSWVGQPLEVHDAPTPFGRISFALRWHGDRPALLWDLEAADGVGQVIISAPGLDGSWRSTERRGDALLTAVATERTTP